MEIIKNDFNIIKSCVAIGMWLLVFLGCQPSSEPISYNKDIRPIINAKCISCHGGVKQSGGFSMLFEEEAMAMTKSGKPAIIPGNSRKSELVKRLRHVDEELRMPLDRDALSEHEIQLISDWIDQGAHWEDHWAYIPPDTSIVLPKSKFPNIAQNEIDSFVFNKLADIGLEPSPVAAENILLRRLYLDLIGLPPLKADYKRFLNDSSDSAYENVIDSLLSSPAFGEKWASMWLDLARYADSKGYEKDLPREIWKYRDYVIQALNQDIGFDQFTIEQLAGDLLNQPSESQLIATAFLRNSISNDEGGTNNEEFRVASVLERVGTTFQVWQGTTMECVQCHSHPYDPIKHEEFYQAMAIFNNTADSDLYNEQPKLVSYEKMSENEVGELLEWLEDQFDQKTDEDLLLGQRTQALMDSIDYLFVEAEEFQASSAFIELVMHDQRSVWQVQDSSWIMFEDVDLTDIESISMNYASLYGAVVDLRIDEALGPKIGEVKLRVTEERFPDNKPEHWTVLQAEIQPTSGRHDLYFYFRKDQEYAQDLLRLDWVFFNKKEAQYLRLDNVEQQKLNKLLDIPKVETPILQELSGEKKRQTHVFARGDWRNQEEVVESGIPASFGKIQASDVDRLSFARWLTHDENPLTARVFINRIWEQIFGFGIVETLEDFGSQGSKPSHPALLDYLAVEFKGKHQWKLKPLLKQILMSATYQQQSNVDSIRLERDPYNKFLSRGSRTRLSAEVIRDQALALSGLLSNKMYGPSVMPYQPESIVAFGGQFWNESSGEDLYRRAVYTYWKRTNSYPSMVAFDSPTREICVSRRIRTNTPLQALVLLNDPVYVEASKALAEKIYMEYPDNLEKGIRAYLNLVTVTPSIAKEEELLSFYRESLAYYQSELMSKEPLKNQITAALAMVTNVILNLDEFVTRR